MADSGCPPSTVQFSRDTHYAYTRDAKSGIFFVLCVRDIGTSASYILELLVRLVAVIRECCQGELADHVVREALTEIYDAIDEIFDHGYPQTCSHVAGWMAGSYLN